MMTTDARGQAAGDPDPERRWELPGGLWIEPVPTAPGLMIRRGSGAVLVPLAVVSRLVGALAEAAAELAGELAPGGR